MRTCWTTVSAFSEQCYRWNSWVEHGVKKSQIYTRNRRTGEGAPKIWEYMQELIDQHVEKGHVIDDMS